MAGGLDDFMSQAMENMDEEQAQQILGQLGEEDVAKSIDWVFENSIVPHLEDIRRDARKNPDPEVVREQLKSLPPEEQEDFFYETLDELVASLIEIRQQPVSGFQNLKTMLRDPYTMESLLLIFESPEHIDEEYMGTLKDFGAEHVRWVGALVFPEMYDDVEVEEVVSRLDVSHTSPDDQQPE